MESHVRPTINRSPRTKSRTGGAACAALNRRPRRRRLLTVPRICLRSAMLAASPMRHTDSMRSAGPRRLWRGETCLASPTEWKDQKDGRAGGALPPHPETPRPPQSSRCRSRTIIPTANAVRLHEKGGTLENAQAVAAHESSTTKLDDRRSRRRATRRGEGNTGDHQA